MQIDYEYDAIGNITRAVEDGVEHLYTYDELSRLTSWTRKEGGQVTWEEKYYYDGGGNIVEVDCNGTPEQHAYDAAGQCTDNGFTYDECGNLTSDGYWVYAYDRGSRLISATSASANLKLVFGYDPRGLRCSKCAYERDGQGQYTVQKYAYCYHYDAAGNVLCETDAAGNVIRSYAYDLSGHPIAFTQDLGQGQKTFYIHTNARGDVVCVTDDVQNWVKKYTYDPWGNITSETSSSGQYDNLDSHYAYAGYFRDAETGLYYMPARYYSSAQRRFLVKDPHPGSKSNPLTLNPYQYCENNPVNNVDPSGQYSFKFSGLGGFTGINYTPGINVGNCGVSNFIAAQEGFRAAGLKAAEFAASMASFNASVHRNLAGFRAPSFSGMGGALSYLHGLAVGKAFVKGMNKILRPFEETAKHYRTLQLPKTPWYESLYNWVTEHITMPHMRGYQNTYGDSELNQRVTKGILGLGVVVAGAAVGYIPAVWAGGTLVYSAVSGESWMQTLYNMIYPPGR
ncbi:MAG: hypothetical protein C4536_10765 [Actinobacteria bacterium]|nr:MAG: hypothetical protein C4536_10765 [Actinomycetota bacterium]